MQAVWSTTNGGNLRAWVGGGNRALTFRLRMFFIPVELATTASAPKWRTTPSWRETTRSVHFGTTRSVRFGTTRSVHFGTTRSVRFGTTRSVRFGTTRSWRRGTIRSWHGTTCYPSRSCDYWEFQCRNGQCVDRSVVCDGSFNCHDGSDEAWFNCES